MVLDRKRDAVDPILNLIAKKVSHISANIFTWLALIFAVLSGLFFYISTPENELISFYLFAASFFIFLNGLFDAIDGKVAKITNTTSLKGDFLDHALDRYADVFIVGGLALSSWCDLRIGFFAIIGMLLTSYMGTQSQAVGYKRVYAGLLGRADRLVLLIVAPILQHIFIRLDLVLIYNFTLLEWILIYIAVIGNLTAVQRFVKTMNYFNKKID
jgi:archaetidylinositol phosphate synthase